MTINQHMMRKVKRVMRMIQKFKALVVVIYGNLPVFPEWTGLDDVE